MPKFQAASIRDLMTGGYMLKESKDAVEAAWPEMRATEFKDRMLRKLDGITNGSESFGILNEFSVNHIKLIREFVNSFPT